MEPTTPAAPQAPVQQAPPAPPVPPATPQQVPKKSKKPLIMGIIIMLVLLVLAIAGYFIFIKNTPLPVVAPTPTPTQSNPSTPIPTASSAALSETVILKKGIEAVVPRTDIALTFVQGPDLPENCIDCISTTIITIRQGSNKEELNYSCGGIAGECINKLSQFGINVEIQEEIDSETLKVLVTNK